MVIQIDAEQGDTLQSCAEKAGQVANALQVNVKFYFDRQGYYVQPEFAKPGYKVKPLSKAPKGA